MTYVKQLEEYEEAVMRKRLEEMPDAGGCWLPVIIQLLRTCCGGQCVQAAGGDAPRRWVHAEYSA